MYQAQALAEQSDDKELQDKFAPIAQHLTDNEDKIVSEFNGVQGNAVDLGGYFMPEFEKISSALFDGEIDQLKKAV